MSWVGATARQIARAVRRGDANATEVVADHLDHLRAADRTLAALTHVRAAAAMSEAAAVDEQPELGNLPLAGVPVVVKENLPVAGIATRYGSAATVLPVADADHETVRRLRGAGAIVVGISRMPEMGLWGTTDDAEAVTRNPWRGDRTAGGSSGGSAAAVAAGMVPLALGNDGLGSIRIPAACCGLVGLKPGRGVVPAGVGATDWFGFAENGVLATSVADAAVGFSVIAGRAPAKLVEPSRLRVAASVRSPMPGVFPDADSRDAVARAGRLLVGAGHSVVKKDPAYPPHRLGPAVFSTWFAAAYRESVALFDALGAGSREVAAVGREGAAFGAGLQPRTRRHIQLGRQAWDRGLYREGRRDAWRDRSVAWFADAGVDLLVTPALAGPPPAAARWHARSWRANMTANVRYAPFTAAWNVAGLPALTVPLGIRRDGLPASIQLVGPPGSELTLLAVAGVIEQAAPWRRYAPGWPRVSSPRQD